MQGMKAIAIRTEKAGRMRHSLAVALVGLAAGLLLTMQVGCSCSCSSDPASKKDLFRRVTGEELEEIKRIAAEKRAKDEKEAAEARANAEAAKRRQEEERRQRAEAERVKREQQQREWQAKVQEEEQQKQKAEPPKPQFPENPADWTKDDFPKARAAGEPRLVEAVHHLGHMFPTSEPAVAALVALLKPAGPPADQRLIEAIVQALGRNRTGAATKALRELVDGKLETELPSLARSKAMHELAERDTSAFDELLLIALRAADDDQRLGRTAFDWEADLLKLIEDRASPSLRVRVAHYAMEVGTSARQREKLLGLLMRPTPANLSSQVVLLAGPATDVAAKPALARQLAMVGSCVLQRLQGMPASVTPAFAVVAGRAAGNSGAYGITSLGGSASPGAAAVGDGAMGIYDDPNLLRYGPAALWSDTAVDLVGESLFQLERLDQAPHLLQLAATMPMARVRRSLLETLRRHWPDGPAGLRNAGVPGQIVFDPALPVLLRTLPHTKPDAREWRRQLSAGAPRQGNYGIGQWDPLHRQKADEAVLDYAWADMLGETTWTLCSRLQAAAEAELAVLGTEAVITRAKEHTPIPLHENARVVAFHEASLPGAIAESSSDEVQVDPVRIRYVRMVDNASLLKTVNHYVRNMHEPAIFIASRTGWIGSLERDTSRGMLRSVDVFIRRTSNTIYRINDPAERLIIQVVCVECADPRAAEDEASPTASASQAGSRPTNSSRLTEN